MVILMTEMDEDMKEKKKQFQLFQEQFYIENDFLVIKETSKDKLMTISKDICFINQSINIYPGFGHISKLTKDYAILFICAKNNTNNIKDYLHTKYGKDLEIGEVIEPTINGKNMCDYFKINVVPL